MNFDAVQICEGKTITVDNNQNVYVAGYYTNTVDFDPGAGTVLLPDTGLSRGFICKLNSNGNLVWAKQVGGRESTTIVDIALDVNNDLCITGIFQGTADFDPGAANFYLTFLGIHDVYVMKLSAQGNFIFAKHIGGSFSEQPSSIATDNAGNICLTGSFYQTTDFDPGQSVYNLTNLSQGSFICKLTAAGDFLWAKQLSAVSTTTNIGESISIDANGNVYTVGHFNNFIDSDPGPAEYYMTSLGQSDVYLLKLNNDGDFIYALQLGGTGYDRGLTLQADQSGNVYVAGTFSNSVDFDACNGTSILNAIGQYDIFIAKYGMAMPDTATQVRLQVSSSADTICSGALVTFTANTVNAGSNPRYEWKINGITAGNNSAILTTNIFSGDVVYCTVFGTRSPCTGSTNYASDTIRLFFNKPSVKIVANANQVCPGTNITFQAITNNTGSVSRYQWQVNNQNTGTNAPLFSSTALQNGDKINCVVTAATLCSAQTGLFSDTIIMSIKAPPVINFLPADPGITFGNLIQLNVILDSPHSNISWQPYIGLSNAAILNPVASPATTTTYKVKVTGTNDCIAERSLTVKVFTAIYIPNSFTPNGDKKNDVFRIPPGIGFELQRFSIYNRFGNLIFSTHDNSKGWDGYYKGSRAPIGTYAYIIEGSDQKGKILLKGTVMLLR